MVLEEYLSFEGVRKCAQCYEALCWEDEEVYCFACKGGNTECPLSYKTWTPPRSAKLSTGGEARSRLATGRRARKVAVVRTPGTPAIPNPETSSPAIPSPGTGTATGTASGTDSATFDQIRGNHAQRTSRPRSFNLPPTAPMGGGIQLFEEHSGPPGGGLRFWGKIFRVPFFGSFGFPTCQMIRKKYSNIRGNPFPV